MTDYNITPSFTFKKDKQFRKFCAYGLLKNLRFYEAFLLLFLLDNGVSFSQIGILYAAKEITTNILEIPSGFIADTYGRKTALMAALVAYIIGFLAYYIAIDFYWLLIASVLIGAGDAFRSGTHKGMIIAYLKKHNWLDDKVAYYGLTRSWSQKGSALSALTAGILVFFTGDYRSICLLTILPYLLNLLNIYSYPEYLNYSNKKTTKKTSLKQTFGQFWTAIKHKKTLVVVNSSALHSAFLKGIKDYIQPLLINLAFVIPLFSDIEQEKRSGLFVGISYFAIFLMTSQASKSSVMLTQTKIKDLAQWTLLLGLSAGIISGLFYQYEYWAVAIVFFISIYIIENLRKPIMTGLLAEKVPGAILTSVLSAQSFYATMITSGLAITLGFMADWKGIGFAISTASAILLLFTLALKFSTANKLHVRD